MFSAILVLNQTGKVFLEEHVNYYISAVVAAYLPLG